jgi:hypothetical protein
MKIVVVEIPAAVVAKIGDPAYQPAIVPAGTYEGQAKDVQAIAVQNFLVTHEGVSADTVYKMTKAMWDNLDALVAEHSAGKAIKKENALKGLPVPLHPGAEKYYREVGLLKSVGGAARSWNGPPPKTATPSLPLPPGRQSANCFGTPSLYPTCHGSDSGSRESPATPAAPAGSDARSSPGAHDPTARNDTGKSGFLPSVVLAASVMVVASSWPQRPLTGLYV